MPLIPYFGSTFHLREFVTNQPGQRWLAPQSALSGGTLAFQRIDISSFSIHYHLRGVRLPDAVQ